MFAPAAESRSPDEHGERLQKVLAAAGLGSRRECETLIAEGRVEVDRQVVTELGTRVDRDRQEIRVDGEPLPRPRLAYYVLHKPQGVLSTARDPSGRPRAIDLLPPDVGRIFNVGRLDMSSEGLLLLTNDGELTNRLTHPRYGVPKTYHAHVAGAPAPEVLAKLEQGVYLAEGFAHVESIRVKGKRGKSTVLEMVLNEGRNREIRRMLARVGHKVLRLIRIAVGPLRLGEMPPGAYRPLSREEVTALRRVAFGETQPGGEHGEPAGKPARRPPRKPPRRPKGAKRPGAAPAGRVVIGEESEGTRPPRKGARPPGGKKKKSAVGKGSATRAPGKKQTPGGKPPRKTAKKGPPKRRPEGKGRRR